MDINLECNDCSLSALLQGDEATIYSDNKLIHIDTLRDKYLLLCKKCNRYWEMSWENPKGQDYGRTTLKKRAISDLINRWPSHLLMQPGKIKEWFNLVTQNFDFLLARSFSFYRVALPLSDFSIEKATYVKPKNSIVISWQDDQAEVILFLSVVPPGNGCRLSQILNYLGLSPKETEISDKGLLFSQLGNLLDANWDQIHELLRDMSLEELMLRFGSK